MEGLIVRIPVKAGMTPVAKYPSLFFFANFAALRDI